MIWRFILLLISWLLSESAAILVSFILGSVIKHFWGKSAMEIIKGKEKEEEDEED
jgi:phosphate/sulfate permease